MSGSESIEKRVAFLYEERRMELYRFLVAQGLPPAVAQEVTQDVFVDLYKALTSGAQIQSELGWLYTVAGRAAVDYWRREHRPIWVEVDSESLVSGQTDPEQMSMEQQRLRRVASALCRLSKEQRLGISLRMQGLRYREIAKILGVSTSTAAEWISIAVERLRKGAHD